MRRSAELSTSRDTTICLGGQASMSAWGTFGDSSYIYTWTGIGTGATTQVIPTITTSYQVILDDQCSADDDTAWIKVNVRPALDAEIMPDTTICIGQSVDLWVKGHGGDSSYTYTWDNGLGTTALENTTPTSTTTYQLLLGDACTVTDDIAYTTVFVRPALSMVVSNDTTICLGHSVRLEAIGDGGDSTYIYSWNQGLGSGAVKTVSPSATTTYTVILDDNCSPDIQAQVTVTVETSPVDFTVSPLAVCLGDSITFTSQITAPGVYSYLWRFGDQQTASDQNPVHTYQSPGSYNVTMVAISANLCRDSVTHTNAAEVYPLPVAAYVATPAVTNLLKPTIQFTNKSLRGYTYDWTLGDMSISTDKDPKHTYLDTGWYDVSLITTSVNNCTDTTYGRIRINDYYQIFIPNAFTPNDDGINDEFLIKGRGIGIYHISIFNRWGETVYEGNDAKLSWDGRLPTQKRPSPG